jgi:MFS family permease
MNRWAILAILFTARTGLGLQFQTVGSVSEEMAAELGLNFTQIGTLIGFFMLPGLFLALPAGYAGRFASDRAVACFGLACLTFGGALVALAPGFAAAAAGRLICGAGFLFATLYFTKMITDWFAGKEIATAMGLLVMSWPLGIAIGQIGYGWLAKSLHWQLAFYAASAFCALGLLLVLLFYRQPPAAPAATSGQRSALSRREFFLISLASLVWAAFNAAYIVYLSFAPRLLEQSGFGPIEAAVVASLASWATIVSIPICGQVVDRSGRADAVLYVCLLTGALALVLLPYGPMAVAAALALGLLGTAPAGAIMALPGEALKPRNRAFGMGIFFSWYFVMTAPAPIIAGWLYDLNNDARGPIYFAAALLAATAAANLAFRLAQWRAAPGGGP